MTVRRIAATYALCALAGLVIAVLSFRDRPRVVHTLPATQPVPISLPRAVP